MHHGLGHLHLLQVLKSGLTLCKYVRTLTCRMSARVHQKLQVKAARPHAVTIAEDPLLSQLIVGLCRSVPPMNVDVWIRGEHH